MSEVYRHRNPLMRPFVISLGVIGVATGAVVLAARHDSYDDQHRQYVATTQLNRPGRTLTARSGFDLFCSENGRRSASIHMVGQMVLTRDGTGHPLFVDKVLHPQIDSCREAVAFVLNGVQSQTVGGVLQEALADAQDGIQSTFAEQQLVRSYDGDIDASVKHGAQVVVFAARA